MRFFPQLLLGLTALRLSSTAVALPQPSGNSITVQGTNAAHVHDPSKAQQPSQQDQGSHEGHEDTESRFAFPYGVEKIRGVHLGGWLLIQSWVTPSLFDAAKDPRIVDDYTFGQYTDRKLATRLLKNHWDTWITEKDFAAIAAAGLNHVTISVGYWAFDLHKDEPYIDGQVPYILKAVDWADKYGLKIIISLYGAPGSQNGFFNSGHLSTPGWINNQTNVDRTVRVMERISELFNEHSDVVTVVTAVSEPKTPSTNIEQQRLNKFYQKTYDAFRFPNGKDSENEGDIVPAFHDAFQGISYWRDFMAEPEYEGVLLETHVYQGIDHGYSWNDTQHIANICTRAKHLGQWSFVGSWTTAHTDCTKNFNGRGVTGTRREGTFPLPPKKPHKAVGSCAGLAGKADGFSKEYRKFLGDYFDAQVTTYESNDTAGWVMWAWKTESADEWSYSKGLEYGWIPKDVKAKRQPGICDVYWKAQAAV